MRTHQIIYFWYHYPVTLALQCYWTPVNRPEWLQNMACETGGLGLLLCLGLWLLTTSYHIILLSLLKPGVSLTLVRDVH